MGLVGSSRDLRTFLNGIERQGIQHKVLWLGEADLPPPGPLSRMTERQRKVMGAAYSLGFDKVLRQIDPSDLSRALGLARATVDVHLRKAESQVVAQALEGPRPRSQKDSAATSGRSRRATSDPSMLEAATQFAPY